MSNYNSQLQSNNTDLQTVLQTLQTKAAQATPVISVNTSGLITATAGTKSSTHQLAFQPAKTIIPSAASQIAVSSGYYTGGNITVVGDNNLVAENIKSGVSIFGVSGTLVEGSGSGSGEAAEWSENEDAIISRTISSSYTNDRVMNIGDYAFYSCSNLTTINFPACITIGNRAFDHCSNLTSVNFPACTTIGGYAFDTCKSLTSISFPACRTITSVMAFYSCYNLTTANFPACTSIGEYAFAQCIRLTSVSFPVCTTIGSKAFYYCYNLTTVNFPAAITINEYAFSRCSHITSVSFPVCTTISYRAFDYCYNLTTVNFSTCTSIEDGVFSQCTRLSSLALGATSVCTLSNSNAFTLTPYAGYSSHFSGTPYIYVPTSLVDAYKTATNWTYFSSYFSAIEDAPV